MPLVKALPRNSQLACKIRVGNLNISRSLTSCTSKKSILNGFKSSTGSLLSSMNAQNCLNECQKRGVRVFQPIDIQDPPPTVVEVQQRVLKAIKTFDRLPKDKERFKIAESEIFPGATRPKDRAVHFLRKLSAIRRESTKRMENFCLTCIILIDFEIADEAGDSLMTPNDLVKYVCENTLITIEESAPSS
uniref:Uncharacterized protein n=1 Tax=Romanomermis culicivorax TaxID=13658 RepID=A0A915JK56_ROMCU